MAELNKSHKRMLDEVIEIMSVTISNSNLNTIHIHQYRNPSKKQRREGGEREDDADENEEEKGKEVKSKKVVVEEEEKRAEFVPASSPIEMEEESEEMQLARDYKLPSGVSLSRAFKNTNGDESCLCVQINSEKLADEDHFHLLYLFPVPPQPSENFKNLIDVFKRRINKEKVQLPETEAEEYSDEFFYVQDALSLTHYLDGLLQKSEGRGEVYFDYHVWGKVVDNAFRGGDVLLDRRELEPKIKSKQNYDGIFGSSSGTEIDLGFIEMKPKRNGSSQRAYATDRAKVTQAMIKALGKYRHVNDLVLIGIVIDVTFARCSKASGKRGCVSSWRNLRSRW